MLELLPDSNNKLNEKKIGNDKYKIFNDLSYVFSIEIQNLKSLEIVLGEPPLKENLEGVKIIYYFAFKLLEDLFGTVLDYQELIESHYSYLYRPKDDWTKFCKICIFLLTVREYIKTYDCEKVRNQIKEKSYYKDLENLKNYELIIGTTNYNRFIEKVLKGQKVYYLNGCVDLEYDPYDNKILQTDDEKNKNHHLTVPLIFTQTTTKPMTSVWMSEQYSDYYKQLKECEVIGVLGYGFNADDGFINSMIREIIVQGKRVVVFVYPENDSFDEKAEKEEKKNLCLKLHLDFDESKKPIENLSIQNLKTYKENWTNFLRHHQYVW